MANKKHKQTFAEMLKELKESSVSKGKAVETIEERKYFLIVCEGERTEPIYFEYIKKFLPKHLLETITTVGAGDNTINVVNRAMEEREKRIGNAVLPPFDEAWAVFDKDDFPDERFNEAISLAQANNVNSGHSNQAFELWYVLHFQYLDTALTRQDYIEILSDKLKVKYEKNNEKIAEMLFKNGNVVQAFHWANRLINEHQDKSAAKSCPLTHVHLLVCRLLKYTQDERFKDLNC